MMKRYLRWPLGIRFQLMLWYTAAFAVLIPLCGLLLYHDVQDSLVASLDTTLAIRAQQLASGITDHQGTIQIDARASDLPALTSGNQTKTANAQMGPWVRLLDTHGRVVYMTLPFENLSPASLSLIQTQQGPPWQGTLAPAQGPDIRVYSQTLTTTNKPFAVLQVGESLTGVYHTLRRMAEDLLVLGFVVLVGSAVGSYWLASRAFAPIGHLTRTARAIKAGDLQQRVPIPHAQDEVYFLAVTLNEMIAHLDQAFTRQRRFVADASHELRTPVAAIRSKAQMALLHVVPPENYLSVFQEVYTESQRLGRLISDLLALARGDEGQTRFEQEPVQLDRLAQMVVTTASPLAAQRGLILQVQVNEPVTVIGDEARLIQAVMNLLDNAMRYTHAGGQVTISLTATAQQVCLTVRDTGRGIAPEHLPHIFERFYRVNPTQEQTMDGNSGLGLSIVKWVIVAHRGTVTVESQVGQGTQFLITLPRQLSKEPEARHTDTWHANKGVRALVQKMRLR